MKRIFIIFTTLIIIGCSKDPLEEYDINNKESANLIFQSYFDRFKEEAILRGYNFSDYEIEFYFADIDGKPVGGLSVSSREIIIDRDNWNAIHSNVKEKLVFHELGHSILRRKHKNQQTESEECLSYMGEQSNRCSIISNSSLWREYYFDELFDENTTLPAWYGDNENYNFNYNNKELLIQEIDNYDRSYKKDINIDTISNFILEVTFKNWQSTSENSPFRNTKINLNGINYESNPNQENIYISNNDYSKRYFSKWDYIYEEDIKLTIRRNEDVFSFFIDENLIHITDIAHLETKILKVDFSPDIKKDIILYKFD